MNYSEEEKEAIDRLDFFNKTGYATFMIKYGLDRTAANAIIERTIKIVLNLIQKQDKIIDKMAEHIYKGCDFDNRIKTKEQIMEYFKKVVDEDVKD